MRREKSGCTKAELQAEGGGGLRLGSDRLRIRGIISGIYCLLALWDEKQRDLLALPFNFFLFFFFFNVAGELGFPRATPASAWQPPGAAANVLGLQVLLGTKLVRDLLP